MEFKEPVGGIMSGLFCRIKDDRTKPIEIIRKNHNILGSQVQQKNFGKFIKLMQGNDSEGGQSTTIQTGEDLPIHAQTRKSTIKQSISPYQVHDTTESISLAENPLVKMRFLNKQSLLNNLLPTQSTDQTLSSLSV